jgi:PAS domain S-box-containing protein
VKPWRIALAYVAFSLLALALFAVPLWYGWRMDVGTLRVFVPEELQALPDLFRREGPTAVAAVVRSRLDPAQREVVVFAGPDKQVIAGTLPHWPAEIPDAGGTYGHVIDGARGAPVRVVVSHVPLPDGYRLLIGRESAGLMSLEGRFWYGFVASMTIVLALGAALAWILATRANEARRSEERYARAVQASRDGIWEWNVATDEFVMSDHARELFAVPDGTIVRTRSDLPRLGGFDPGEVERAANEGREHKLNIEYHVGGADGNVRWIRSQGRVFPGAKGRPTLVTGSVTDVTAQRLAEEARRLSEERYALAVAGANDGVWDIDFINGRVFVSARSRELMGMLPGPEAMSWEEWSTKLPVHPDDAPERTVAFRAHLAGKTPAYIGELRLLQLDGTYRWRRVRGLCVRGEDGQPTRMAGSISDIDDRRCAEEALRLSEERYSLALEASGEGHFDIDVKTDGLFMSERMYEIFGYPVGAHFRRKQDFKAQFPFYGNDGDKYWSVVNAAMVQGAADHYEFEFRIVRPSGEVRWLSTRGKITRDADGHAVRRVGTCRDITDAKLGEEALKKMEAQLRRAQRLEGIGTLAGGIAHDFNNILGAILGYGEMAMRDAEHGSRLRRDLESIMVAGERGRALVDRILAFSRSGVGERTAVHVEAVVSEVLVQIAGGLPKGVSITQQLRAGRAAMLGDSTQVHQVVTNLALNAVQAMPRGGALRVSLETARFDQARSAIIGMIEPGEYIVLLLSDTGTGIADDVLEKMFDPFFTTKDVGVGSGLGLSLVHGIVTGVGGAIDVVTEVGKGTTFTVYLPRDGDARQQAPDDKTPLHRGEGQRILVLDDEESLVRLAIETLESLGYAPVGFTSSAAALAAFRANPESFDALLTDERMPGLTGSALIRHVRAIRESMPVVLMSGYLGIECRDADVVVRKPLSARDLAAGMARALA